MTLKQTKAGARSLFPSL